MTDFLRSERRNLSVAEEVKRTIKIEKRKVNYRVYFKRYWQLYALLALPLIYLLVFKYVPMTYVQIAFKKYLINKSIWVMPWAKNGGFEYYIRAFRDRDFLYALRNTLLLNFKDLLFGFPAPIIFALILNELPFKGFKKVVQTIAYMPHFLSWVIIGSLSLQLFAQDSGMINMLITSLGGKPIPFLTDGAHWVRTYIGWGIWQSFGWNSIVYLAAIAGISPDLYEAASMDGAGRFAKMWHITLPGLKPTIVVLLIMNLGYIMGGGMERPMALYNNLVMDKADVIATYVYRVGIKGLQFSLTTAVGLFQSIVGVILILSANFISRKLGERGIW
ncbi:MAG: sugar ABC transporter permease [Lachnospiraceae bacterium]|nr:sugar ABC transporter permease [Lachnospiraceae bacterium]